MDMGEYNNAACDPQDESNSCENKKHFLVEQRAFREIDDHDADAVKGVVQYDAP